MLCCGIPRKKIFEALMYSQKQIKCEWKAMPRRHSGCRDVIVIRAAPRHREYGVKTSNGTVELRHLVPLSATLRGSEVTSSTFALVRLCTECARRRCQLLNWGCFNRLVGQKLHYISECP